MFRSDIPTHAQQTGKSSLQFLIVVFVTSIACAIVILFSWAIWNSYHRTLDEAREEAMNLSLSLSRQAEDTLLQVDITQQDLVERIEQGGTGAASLIRLKEYIGQQQANLAQLNSIFIFDAQGNVLVASNKLPLRSMKNADRAYFRFHQHNKQKDLYIGGAIASRITGEWVIPVSRRVNNPDGSFGGVVLETIAISYFKQYYGYFALKNQDVLALMLTDGTLLYRRPSDPAQTGKNLSASPMFRQHLRDADTGSARFVSPIDHLERVYGYAWLKRYPLVVVAGYALDDVMNRWWYDSLAYGIGGMLMLIMILSLGTIVIRQVKESIRTQHELIDFRNQLIALNGNLEEIARLDELTGLANRRRFDEVIGCEIARAFYAQTPLGLVLFDVDYFKDYNDRYGHVAGDRCLQNIGHLLQHMTLQPAGLIARYGGEEFAVILPGADLAMTHSVAQQLVARVRELSIAHEASQIDARVITISAGIYAYVPNHYTDEARYLIDKADQALYLAKRAGRDRVGIVNEAGKA